ncbi:hypothetical protein JCM10207_001795 [Rhodosporidiobolus poonsookiae]
MTEPPAHLLATFDPTKATVGQLRGILLENEVPYAPNAKKPQLVALFEKHVRPHAPTLLAQYAAIRPSANGILDGESQTGSLNELDTDSEDERRFADEVRRRKGRKSVGRKSIGRMRSGEGVGREARSAKKGKGRAREEREESSEEEAEEDELEMDVRPRGPKMAKKTQEVEVDSEDEMALDGEDDEEEVEERTVSPKKRKAQDVPTPGRTPRLSDLTAPASALKHRPSLAHLDSPSDAGNFSDFNPFQSGGEETPGREKKRRKSAAGPSRLASRKSLSSLHPPSTSTSSTPGRLPSSVSSSALSSAAAGGWAPSPASAKRTQGRKSDVPPVPPLPSTSASSFFAPTSSAPASGSKTQRRKHASAPARVAEREPDPEPESEEEEEEDEDEPMRDVSPAPEPEAGQVEEEEDDDLPPEPTYELPFPTPAVPTPVRSAHHQDTRRTSTPVGKRYMVPVDKVRTSATPPSARHEREPAPAHTRTVAIRAEENMARASPRRSEPAPPTSAAKRSTPRRSLPVSAERAHGRAVPSPSQRVAVRDAVSLSPPPSPRAAKFSLKAWLVPLLLVYLLWYRSETLSCGFCDPSSPSNPAVDARAETGQTSLAWPVVPPLPGPVLRAADALGLRPGCTACPSHGVCEEGRFTACEADYVPRSSLLSTLTAGLIPSPPRCAADTEKQVAVARQAALAHRLLRRRRGEVRCARGVERGRKREAKARGLREEEEGAWEAWVWGERGEGVWGALERENEISPFPFAEEVLEEINRLALRDLEVHGEVVVWRNATDPTDVWYASKTADMPLSCRARLALLDSAKRHKTGLFTALALFAAVLYGRYRLQKRKQDKETVRQLVQLALRHLQQQERAHHLAPASTPYAHLAPSHLRDLLLASFHSPHRRDQLWKQVERVVEGNANVTAGVVEQGGEEMRGWRWTGPTLRDGEGEGQGEGGREMVQIGGRGGGASLPGTPR